MWKGFIRESVSYINPKGLREWIKFIVRFPKAWTRFMILEAKKGNMGKVLVGLVMMVWLVGSEVAWGYTTFKDIYDAGMAKYVIGNYVDARTVFAQTPTASNNSTIELNYKKWISVHNASSYRENKEWTTGITEIDKALLNYSDGDAGIILKWNRAMCKQGLGTVTVNDFLDVINISGIHHLKNEAWNIIIGLKPDWTVLIASIKTNNWEGLFYRAKVKQQAGQTFVNINADLTEALKLLPTEDPSRKEVLQYRETLCMDMAGMKYSDWKVANP
mgnify:CR=1 FL=1